MSVAKQCIQPGDLSTGPVINILTVSKIVSDHGFRWVN